MPLEIEPVRLPETPRFWASLEQELTDAAAVQVHNPDAPATPRFDERVGHRLAARAPEYAEPGFPVTAFAAIVSIVLVTAMLIQFLPGLSVSNDLASPGVVPTAEVDAPATVSAEAMVVASLSRFADDRSEADRLAEDLRNRGYEVTVAQRLVTDPELHGAVLEVRHGADTTGATITAQDVRGPVILIVAQARSVRPVS